MRVCAELIDLGMDLARLAAARARTELADPEEAVPPAPEPGSLPPAEMETALVGTLRRAIKSYTRRPNTQPRPEKPATAAQIFVRLTAAIRACVTLEARLAAGTAATHRAAAPRHADPRRTPLLDGFRLVTKTHPERIDLMRQATARLDQRLAEDPEQRIDIPEIFFAIADELKIEVDLATLPDLYLGMAPSPRATSPP